MAAPAASSDNWKKQSTGHFARPVVKSKTTVAVTHDISVELIEFESKTSFEGATMLQSFQGATLTSVLVGGFVREALGLPLIGVISSPHFPPRCLVEGGVPSHAVRLFGNSKLVIASCEFKVTQPELIHALTRACLTFAKSNKLKLIVTVEGLPLDDVKDEQASTLAFVSTSLAFSAKMAALKHEPLGDSVLVGSAGSLLADSVLWDIDVACLVAPTAQAFPDARSAVTCVKALDAFLDELTIDTTPLEKKAEALQASVSKLLKQDRNEKSQHSMFL